MFLNAVKFGLLSAQRRIRSGYGLQLTDIREKLPEHMPEAWTRKAHAAFGIRFLNHAEEMPCFILISGRHMKKFFLGADIFSVGKESGKTSHIERFDLTLQQRAARLGRKTLSFSKNMRNHIGALWNFIHHYNENIASKLITTS